jgi:dipeptidyl aminopeptidase/acylaminoacyl peptidase
VAIYGASYGGYAAMAGLIFTPELYKCGINYVGVVDPLAMIDDIPVQRRFSRALMYELIGNPKTESAYLREISPLEHLNRLRAPVLLAYGGLDQRVKIDQGRALSGELTRLKKPHVTIIEDDEGHGFQHLTPRLRLYRKMEDFLRKNL